MFLIALYSMFLPAHAGQFTKKLKNPAPIELVDDKATIVFTSMDGLQSALTTIIDAEGRFVAEIIRYGAVVTRVEPGTHHFISWSLGSRALEATVEGGALYYIDLEAQVGAPFNPLYTLVGKGPGREKWDSYQRRVRRRVKRRLVNDVPAAQARMDLRSEDRARVIQQARGGWDELDAAERHRRSITPEDAVPGQLEHD